MKFYDSHLICGYTQIIRDVTAWVCYYEFYNLCVCDDDHGAGWFYNDIIVLFSDSSRYVEITSHDTTSVNVVRWLCVDSSMAIFGVYFAHVGVCNGDHDIFSTRSMDGFS